MATDAMTRLLTLDKVAELLGCSIYSIRRYVTLGSIKATRIGSRVMVSAAEVVRIQAEGLASIPLGGPKVAADESAPGVARKKGKSTN